MKKILTVILSLIIISGIAIAYTVTITVGWITLRGTSEEGNRIGIIPKIELESWEVESGGVTVNNNEFVMPGQDVVINGVIAE